MQCLPFGKELSIEARQLIVQQLNILQKNKGTMHKVWTNSTHLIGLVEFVPLADVPTLQSCHQVALKHPSVIVGNRNSNGEEHPDTRLNLDTTGVNQKDLSSTKIFHQHYNPSCSSHHN